MCWGKKLDQKIICTIFDKHGQNRHEVYDTVYVQHGHDLDILKIINSGDVSFQETGLSSQKLSSGLVCWFHRTDSLQTGTQSISFRF